MSVRRRLWIEKEVYVICVKLILCSCLNTTAGPSLCSLNNFGDGVLVNVKKKHNHSNELSETALVHCSREFYPVFHVGISSKKPSKPDPVNKLLVIVNICKWNAFIGVYSAKSFEFEGSCQCKQYFRKI